jgi:FO synthase subunit 2
MDPNVILNAALEHREISAIESLLLLQQEQHMLPEIFHVANHLNHRLNLHDVSYVHSLHITYTNVCRAACRFCSFFRRRGSPNTFTLTIDDVLERIGKCHDVSEVCLQGGLNPELNIKYFCDMFSAIKAAFPQVHIHGLSPAEVYFLSKKMRVPATEVLLRLRERGLDSMPGTGAEILNDKIRKKVCPGKLRTAEWVDVVKAAHRRGIRTGASIMFGHIENEIHVCEHLEIVRNIQKETNGFIDFTLMPFVPPNTEIWRTNHKRCSGPTLESILKLVAVCRIFFNRSMKHLQLPWSIVSLDTALKSLHAGVNDIGGTVFDSGLISVQSSLQAAKTPQELEKSITKTGKTARRRDTLYNTIVAPKRRAPTMAAACRV